MSTEFREITELRREAELRMFQRNFAVKNPSEALKSANEIITKWKSEWDKRSTEGGEKPRSTEVNNAKRLRSSLLPIINSIEQAKSDLAEKIANKLNVDNGQFAQDEILATGAILEIDKFPPTGYNPDTPKIISNVSNSLQRNGIVQLLMFSCPEIDAGLLASGYPDMYIKTVAGINTGTADPRPINKLGQILSALDIPFGLEIIVGELDEESYIFPVLGDFGTNKATLKQNRLEYLESFKVQATNTFTNAVVNVFGWSEFDNESVTYNAPLPSMAFIDEEVDRMGSLFQTERYYDGLPVPTNEQLFRMSKLKMKTYAKQGKTLKKLFPYAIGVQNEFPAALRTVMLNAGLIEDGLDTISMVYPFEERESLY